MADYLGKDTFKLGFGLMRLPRLEDGTIDVKQTSEMVDLFIEAGGTYFDTAFAYTGSEEAIRKASEEVSQLAKQADEKAKAEALALADNNENRKAVMRTKAESRAKQAVDLIVERIVNS